MCDIGQKKAGSGLHTQHGQEDEIAPEKWIGILNGIRATTVCITMTEPLLYSGLEKLIEGLEDKSISITTNGYLLAKYADILIKNKVHVCVSIDGVGSVHDLIRGVDGAFTAAIAGSAKIYGKTTLAFSCAVSKYNQNELVEINEFLEKNFPGSQIVFNHYNIIHPESAALTPSCEAANTGDLFDVDIEKIFEAVEKIGANKFGPPLKTKTQIGKYYLDVPKTSLKLPCPRLARALKGEKYSYNASGTRIVSHRCWIKIKKDFLLEAAGWNTHFAKTGLPPACQRLCCGGMTV
jgi:MoaA/NifB/PqqE/SkfB family radical SAM enzyme